jgi:hypothetical protein
VDSDGELVVTVERLRDQGKLLACPEARDHVGAVVVLESRNMASAEDELILAWWHVLNEAARPRNHGGILRSLRSASEPATS